MGGRPTPSGNPLGPRRRYEVALHVVALSSASDAAGHDKTASCPPEAASTARVPPQEGVEMKLVVWGPVKKKTKQGPAPGGVECSLAGVAYHGDCCS